MKKWISNKYEAFKVRAFTQKLNWRELEGSRNIDTSCIYNGSDVNEMRTALSKENGVLTDRISKAETKVETAEASLKACQEASQPIKEYLVKTNGGDIQVFAHTTEENKTDGNTYFNCFVNATSRNCGHRGYHYSLQTETREITKITTANIVEISVV